MGEETWHKDFCSILWQDVLIWQNVLIKRTRICTLAFWLWTHAHNPCTTYLFIYKIFYLKVESESRVQLFVSSWTVQISLGQNTGVGSLSLLPNPIIEPRSPTLQVNSLPAEPQGTPKNTGVGSLSLLQGIFPTQELYGGVLHCRQFLYQLSYQRSTV